MTGATGPDDSRAAARRAWLTRVRESIDEDASAPLWRAAQVFRALSLVYSVGFQFAVNNDLERPAVAAGLGIGLVAWTLVCAVAYLAGFGRNWKWVGAELAVTCGFLLSTSYVASSAWITNHQAWPTTLWACNAVISAAILGGASGGALTGLVVWASSVFVKGRVDLNLGRNAQLIQLLFLGLVVGWAATSARRNHELLTQAARFAAASEERDRLARHVHDGVLQALALISRRGREIGGDTAGLADLAGEQERALRQFLTDRDDEDRTYRQESVDVADLAALLRKQAGATVSVSTPREPVALPTAVAGEVDAAVRNALDNVARHAGPGAKAFVLLEDLGDEVVVSVRDDGVGIEPGRLAAAVDEGRLGVAKSIVGRIEALGGRVELDSTPGAGTDWELTVPTARGEEG
ncbi:MacS family sensor histidine kinase [Gordonia sp. (in: high G+C Gram-positive bacteria)]|uniref:MacS family sensor histidine kinase n=1 Tax=Gordonia sp. (in: high G+C Gram-positive bacteria) TaxID=84139 RepID=UPI0039E4B521